MNNKKKYTINEDFFENIDSEEKAYFLGFFYADAGLDDNGKKVMFALAAQDLEIIIKLQQCLESNIPIKITSRKRLGENNQDRCLFLISRKKIWSDLSRLGLYQNKSLTLSPDPIKFLSDEIFRHFIRGYFDGDGCISVHKPKNRTGFQSAVTILSTIEFIEYIKVRLSFLNINMRITKRHNNDTNCYTLEINGNNQVKKFLGWLYKDSSIYLSRKYNKFVFLNEIVSNGSQRSIKKINVFKFSPDGRLLETYKNLSIAARENNISLGYLSTCLNNNKVIKGYIWKKVEI